MNLHVISPGPLTTVQDAGRTGYAARGFRTCGAADGYAMRTANLLAGNPQAAGAAVLEMTLQGGKYQFDGDAVFALAGADMPAALDGRPVPVVNPSGISISRSLSTLLRSRLSERPGRPTPTAMFLCPSESTFPLSIVTFVKLSTGRIIAVTITNGEYISVFFLPTFTSFLALLVYFTSILRCPLLPARSSGLTWTPSR